MNDPYTPGPSPTGEPPPKGVLQFEPMLRRIVRTWARNVVPFLLIAVIWTVPSAALESQYRFGETTFDQVAQPLLSIALDLIFGGLATAMMVFGALRDLYGRPVGIGECLFRGISTSFSAVGTAVVAALVILLGGLALILPGVILMLMFTVAVPVAVVERPGIIGSLKRSAALTSGNLLRILATFILTSLPLVPLYWLVWEVLEAYGLGLLSTVSLTAFGLVSAIQTSIEAVVSIVIYHDLRLAKDGPDGDNIAMVFE